MPLMKNGSPTTASSPGFLKTIFLASRPRTWIASISPVLIGTAMAAREGSIQPSLFLLTLLFALLIQIGANFANDALDFLNGADTAKRKGPLRVTQQGWISAEKLLRITFITLASALLLAAPLMLRAGWWSLPIALLSVLFALLYTGGPKPLGYLGLGELLVLPFFGPIATCGTYFLQTERIDGSIFLAGLAPGLLSCAILVINNLRDEESDRLASKFTLIARFGRTFGICEYFSLLFLAALVPLLLVLLYNLPSSLLLGSLFILLSIPLKKKIFTFQNPLELIPLLQGTALTQLFYTVLFSLALL